MYPSFKVQKRRNHSHLLYKRVANKKSIGQKRKTNIVSKKIFTANKKEGTSSIQVLIRVCNNGLKGERKNICSQITTVFFLFFFTYMDTYSKTLPLVYLSYLLLPSLQVSLSLSLSIYIYIYISLNNDD